MLLSFHFFIKNKLPENVTVKNDLKRALENNNNDDDDDDS